MKEIVIRIFIDADEDLTKEIQKLISDRIRIMVETKDKETEL